MRRKPENVILWMLIGSTMLSSIFSIIMLNGLYSIKKNLAGN
ncbi:hypothetical protein [Bacillus sp. AFS015802]|nr:hypothetical protein [Bacillus sp. AFS015802]